MYLLPGNKISSTGIVFTLVTGVFWLVEAKAAPLLQWSWQVGSLGPADSKSQCVPKKGSKVDVWAKKGV